MRTLIRSIAIMVAATAAVVSSSAPLRAQGAGDPTIASVKATYEMVKGYITKSVALVPEDKLAYQPTKDVRTMGQLFGHIANASIMICSGASGMKSSSTTDAEKITSKAQMQKAVADAFAFCDHSLMMITPASASETVDLFGTKHSRIGAIAFNNAHLFEHYGNLVTYMRINGMVPPSSAK